MQISAETQKHCYLQINSTRFFNAASVSSNNQHKFLLWMRKTAQYQKLNA